MRSVAGIRRALLVPAGVLVLLCVPAASAHTSTKPRQRFFQTSTGAVECELDDGGAAGIGVDAYCQTALPPRSVTLTAKGHARSCSGQTCIGNAPDNVQTLKAGSSVSLGPFTCRVRSASVSCKVSSGRGFAISPAGVTKL